MAARTLTYTLNMSGPVKGAHLGLNTVVFDVNSGATKFGTVSDVWLLGKVPNGALITDTDLRMGANGAANAVGSLVLLATDALGTYSILATLAGPWTASTAAATFHSALPLKVSLSDDRAVQFAVLALNVSTGVSETVSFSMQGSIKYLADGTGV